MASLFVPTVDQHPLQRKNAFLCQSKGVNRTTFYETVATYCLKISEHVGMVLDDEKSSSNSESSRNFEQEFEEGEGGSDLPLIGNSHRMTGSKTSKTSNHDLRTSSPIRYENNT